MTKVTAVYFVQRAMQSLCDSAGTVLHEEEHEAPTEGLTSLWADEQPAETATRKRASQVKNERAMPSSSIGAG